jgi:hypothetical protein
MDRVGRGGSTATWEEVGGRRGHRGGRREGGGRQEVATHCLLICLTSAAAFSGMRPVMPAYSHPQAIVLSGGAVLLLDDWRLLWFTWSYGYEAAWDPGLRVYVVSERTVRWRAAIDYVLWEYDEPTPAVIAPPTHTHWNPLEWPHPWWG